MIYKITEGLGDCLIAGAALQGLNKPVHLLTNPILAPLFQYHPTIKYIDTTIIDHEITTLKWVSQLKREGINLYPLHTMQRFSFQLGYFLDPTKVLNIFDRQGGQVVNNPEDFVCVNQYSAEKNRRYIPDDIMDVIIDTCPKIFFVGDNKPDIVSYKNLPDLIYCLTKSKLFIGPISFNYHLASCYRTKCLLFTGYMPEHKFSHFFNTTAIGIKTNCSYTCEEDRDNCLPDCYIKYDKDEVRRILLQCLKN